MFGKIKTAFIPLILFVALLTVAVIGVTVYAEGEESAVGFTVYDDTMTEKSELSGEKFEDLRAALPLLSDGDTVVLNSDLRMTGTLGFISSAEAPRTINLDLGGNALYALEKINLISVKDYTTLNVYSSLPGGEIYGTNVENISLGGNIFTIGGESAVINSGKFTVGDVTYPGENLTTYSSCLIDLIMTADGGRLCDENCAVNIDGGNYYSIIHDYSGFIVPRCGKATLNIRHANIVMMDVRALINSAGPETVLNIEDCVLLQADGASQKIFNSAVGKVVFRNCISNFVLGSAESSSEGVVELEGRNVFANSDEANMSLIKSDTPLVKVITKNEYELHGGGKTVRYLDGFSNWNYYEKRMDVIPAPVRYVSEDDVQKYTFKKDKQSITQLWAKDEDPDFPYAVPGNKEEGVYKYDWQMRYQEDGSILYVVACVYDGPLLVSVSENEGLFLNVYFPASFDDEGVINYSGVKVDGEVCASDDWHRAEKNGEKYICLSIEIDADDYSHRYELEVQMYFSAEISTNTLWYLSLGGYIDRVLATEPDGIYSAEDYEFVRGLSSYLE
ncbi:MAG: hypothetical protein E7617_00095 [Ruminococcaceae bacterium]|nr:hypothetical protein [Oscillospiraceae bacterium]